MVFGLLIKYSWGNLLCGFLLLGRHLLSKINLKLQYLLNFINRLAKTFEQLYPNARSAKFISTTSRSLASGETFYLQFLFLARKTFPSSNDFAFPTTLRLKTFHFVLLHQLFETLEHHSFLDLSQGGFAQQASFMHIYKSKTRLFSQIWHSFHGR